MLLALKKWWGQYNDKSDLVDLIKKFLIQIKNGRKKLNNFKRRSEWFKKM